MILTQLDKDLQDIIIQKIHNCWLDEARGKEYITWAYVEYPIDNLCYVQCTSWRISNIESLSILNKTASYSRIVDWKWEQWHKIKIIWLPPTLDRVLYVLWESCIDWWFYVSNTWKMFKYTRPAPEVICERKLLNSNWTSATLFDQSIETKEKIYQLIK